MHHIPWFFLCQETSAQYRGKPYVQVFPKMISSGNILQQLFYKLWYCLKRIDATRKSYDVWKNHHGGLVNHNRNKATKFYRIFLHLNWCQIPSIFKYILTVQAQVQGSSRESILGINGPKRVDERKLRQKNEIKISRN